MKPTKEEYRQRTRPNLEEYDLLVLGSGTTGKLISWTLVKFQQRYEKRHGSLPKPICAKRLCLRGTLQLRKSFKQPILGV